jgi:hypothetical protein
MRAVSALILILMVSTVIAQTDRFASSTVGGKEYQSEQITADLPLEKMMWNIGSRVDGLGMCVDTSLEQAARYHGMNDFVGYRDWSAGFPGGSFPSKVDKQIAAWVKHKKIDAPEYLQYEGPDPGPLLEQIDRTGRIACIAYGYSPRYGGPINHMVYSPKPASGKFAAIVDNNQIGGVNNNEGSRYEWMSRDELIKRMKTAADHRGRAVPINAWVFVWLSPPPPPPPFN